MAGVGVAGADDYESAYLNPAGLAEVRGKRLTIGGVYGDFGLKLDGSQTDTNRPSGVVWGGAFHVPLGGALKDRIGIAIGTYVPSEALVRVDVPLPGAPVYALLETRSDVIGVLSAIGVKLSDRWSVGLGVLALAALRGKIFIDADAAGRFRTNSEQRTITDLAPIVGARYTLPGLRFGLVLRAPSRSDYEIVVTNELGNTLPLSLPTLTIAGTAQYDPLAVAAEAEWIAAPRVKLLGHLTYQHWSSFPLPTKTPIEGMPEQPLPGFHSTVVPRVAAEVAVPIANTTRTVARAGYSFVWSPAPEMDGPQSLLDNHRHVVGLGFGVSWPDSLPLHIDAWAQFHALMPRTHEKDPSQFADPADMPFDTIRTGGHIVIGGLSLGVDL